MIELVKALAKIQAELPKIKKDNTAKVPTKNGGEYSYKYADLASVSDAILPRLSAEGLAWTCLPTLNQAGKFVLAYKLLHESGESLEGEFPLVSSDRPQDQGSSISYSRRYALCSVVGIVPDDDDDGYVASNRPKAAPKPNHVQAKPQPKPVDPATGEILPPVKQLLDALPAAQRAAVQAKLTEANYPPVEQLKGAAERQARRWIDEAKSQADAEAPF